MAREMLEQLWRSAGELCDRGELAAARTALTQILEVSPRQFMVMLRLSELEQAENAYGAAHAWALCAADCVLDTTRWDGLAHVVARLLVFDERLRACKLISSADWQDPRVLRQSPTLSQQLWLCGDDRAALRLIELAERHVVGDHRLAYSRGMALQNLGCTGEAVLAFEACLRLAPDFAPAHWSLACTAISEPPLARVARIREAAARTSDVPDKAMLHYAMYREFDAAGKDDEAWHELAAGAALMRDVTRGAGSVPDASLGALLSGPVGIVQPNQDASDKTPIFIVGMPRTGTTLLSRIVAADPSAADGEELNALQHALSEVLDAFVDLPASAATWRQLAGQGEAWRERVAAAYMRRTLPYYGAGATHLIDKNPMNLFASGLIASALPNARILCLVRGAMDTGYSNLRQLFQNGAYAYSYDLGRVAERYAMFRQAADHFSTCLPGRFLKVSYEALVSDPLTVAREVMAFCGLGFQPDYVDITRNTSRSSTASTAQVRQPIHGQGIGEWRRHAERLQPLAERLLELGIDPSG